MTHTNHTEQNRQETLAKKGRDFKSALAHSVEKNREALKELAQK